MTDFSRRVSQKLDKLTPLQIQQLVEDCYSQTEIFNSIFQSLPSGLIIVDENFCLMKINKAAERYLPFKSNPEEAKEKSPVWNIIDDEEIARFLQALVECSRDYFLYGEQTTVFAMDGDKIAGCASLSYITVMPTFDHPTGKRAHLMNVYTRKEFRRRGVGKIMVEYLIEEAKSRGVTEIRQSITVTENR